MAATLGPAPDATGPALHLERVEGLLQDRFVGSLLRMPGRSWRLVHLETGTARLEDAETPRAWTGPTL